MKSHPVTAQVERFPQKGGWYYVSVPKKYTEMTRKIARRGLVPITVTLGNSSWRTSLLPMGNGTHFIALKAKIRKLESINLGDTISLTFTIG
ncbi:MAG: DUF1905 domain-containing protein [bacterium]|nr:DUF1905 domain-containing protein [bacterium]